MLDFRRSLNLILLLAAGLAAGVFVNSLWPARAAAEASPAQASRFEYAVITNLTTTSSGGKMLATAWIRYLSGTGADPVGVNRSVALTIDFPKDDLALRRWMATTNSEEGVNLSGVNLTTETSRQLLFGQVKRDAVAKAVAKLGDDGWELIGPDGGAGELFGVNPVLGPAGSTTNSPVMLYFKRRAS